MSNDLNWRLREEMKANSLVAKMRSDMDELFGKEEVVNVEPNTFVQKFEELIYRHNPQVNVGELRAAANNPALVSSVFIFCDTTQFIF